MNFVHGHPYVSISLGLAYKSRPAVGVIYNPFYHHLYTAAPGRGSFFEDFRGRKRLPLTDPPPPLGKLCDSLILVEWGKEREGINWETTIETFKNLTSKDGGMVHDLRTFGGAALNLCTVAAGSVDLCWGGGWDAWDVCAGWAILLEAGGKMANGNPAKTTAEPPLEGKKYLAGNYLISFPNCLLIAVSHLVTFPSSPRRPA
jgi:myo-inositol-1(or 4)-monophosphatase